MMNSTEERLGGLSREKQELLKMLLEQQSRQAERIKPRSRSASQASMYLPISWSQQRLWFIDQLERGSVGYHVAIALRLKGDLGLAELRQALDTLVQRHEALRTRFVNVAGEPMQEVIATACFELQVIDLSEGDEFGREALVQLQRLAEIHQKFDLRTGPPIRGRLLRCGVREHVLLITMHHIISDGWSLGVLIEELTELYAAQREGRPDSLESPPIRPSDYAQWQREWLRGPVLERQLRHWCGRLENAAPRLELPTDRPRPLVQSYRGENVGVVLDGNLSARLRLLAQTHGMTLFMVLLAGWAILMSRLSGQYDVTVGTPFANRERAELQRLIGFFVNTLALRIEVLNELTLGQFFRQIKTVTLDAYRHQDTPFEKIVEALHPDRDLARNPVFQVMFALQGTLKKEWHLPDLKLNVEEGIDEPAIFDLFLSLEEQGEEITGSLNFASDLFDRQTVRRWIDSYVVLLDAMTAEGKDRVRIAELPILRAAERRQLVKDFNATQGAFPSEMLIHELFEDRANHTPDALAVIHGDQQLTYRELNLRANRLARMLETHGVGPDRLVGVCIERSVDMIVSLLGILKAGAAYVPLDPTYPAERLHHMLLDAAPLVVLTQGRLSGLLPTTGAKIIVLDSPLTETALAGTIDHRSEVSASPGNLLYVIYTSGSTGTPKGTAMTHRSMVNLIEWHRTTFGNSDGKRVLQFAALSFDVAFQEVFSTLGTGGAIVLLDECIRTDPERLWSYLRDLRIQRLFIPPVMLQALAEYARTAGHIIEGLDDVIAAGEQLRVSPEIESFFTRQAPCYLHNHYGPTETHVVTALTLKGDAGHWPRLPSIGKPLANNQIYVLDEMLNPAPIGVAGEIYIGGAGVARGYLRRPHLTAQRFVVDPFDVSGGSRLYRTGDLGRWRIDGTLEYLGRNDGQVKIRGYRIELGDIEMQLMRDPRVKEAVVIAREDVPGNRHLAAYIKAADADGLSVEDLRLHLQASLPAYMVPSAFVIMSTLPLTPSGKLDRRALPRPDVRAYTTQTYEAPLGDVEEALANIWRELLNVERVGRDDSFFDLGGHSLLAIKMLYLMNERFHSTLTVTDTYKNPSLRALASHIEGRGNQDNFVNLTDEVGKVHFTLKRGLARSNEPAVLLTGATGFVGRFLLHQLLEDSTKVIFCLVRSNANQGDPLSRLRAVLSQWDLWRDEFEQRLVAVPGDLRLPRLGLDEHYYRRISRGIGTIYHCGCSMNHLETYAMARAANVGAIGELMTIATDYELKVVNYISTLGVFSSNENESPRMVDEDSIIDNEEHRNSSGYLASKWVGEKVAMMGREIGVPCNIFRLGLVWADSKRGRYDELQDGYRLLKTCLLLGAGIENYRYEMTPLPVDFVAQSIVSLANGTRNFGSTYNIAAGDYSLGNVFERCNQFADASLDLVPLADWVALVRKSHAEGRALPIAPLIDLYDQTIQSRISVKCTQTHEELNKAGIAVSMLDDQLLELTVENMRARDPELRRIAYR